MFLKRLTRFWMLLLLVALALVARLVDIQVIHAEEFQNLAARIMTRPARYMRAPRGSILARDGRVLVSDEPSADVCIHYAVLTGRSDAYLKALARDLRKRGNYPPGTSLDEIATQLRHQISDMWQRLAQLTGRPVSDFAERGEEVRGQVDRIRAAHFRRTGVDEPVREESGSWLHPVLEDVSDDVALAVRLELGDLPWLRVVPSSHRVVRDADSIVHLLGRLGAVSPSHLANDPLADEELRRLRPDDRCGVSGVEHLAEPVLRGTRGRIVEELDGTVLERIDPQAGGDVRLTIDMALQQHVLDVLEQAVNECATPTGASAVVIDVATREVLALASYPGYQLDRFEVDYEQLRRDAQHTPLRFRAVSGEYPPGSTCKAITLVGALSDGLVNPTERIHCTGHLLPDQPNAFRCWIYNHFRTTHDATENPDGQNGEDAIRNSCNIYFFKLGGRLGAERLCDWFMRLGLGRLQGTGLIEESSGLVPTSDRLRRRHEPADAWNFAIGQGEVAATPLQVANVAATIASGRWAPVCLARGPDEQRLGPNEPAGAELRADVLRVLRTGMWRVVNERHATGEAARLDRTDYVLCGKTGSAEAQPAPIAYRYTFQWPDGRREAVISYLEEDALARFGDEKPRRVGKHVAEQYPALEAGEALPSHAWFMGFTQPASTPRGAMPTGRVYALSVIVEYGGSGGRVAGPVAKDIAEWLLQNRE